LLRSLPVRDPGRLIVLSNTGKAWNGHTSNNGAGVDKAFSYPMYRDLRDRNSVFEGLVVTAPAHVGIARKNTSEFADTELVSGNYFGVLGVSAAEAGCRSTRDSPPGPPGLPCAQPADWHSARAHGHYCTDRRARSGIC